MTETKNILPRAPRHLLSQIDYARNCRLAMAVNALSGDRILNIGCGYGFLEGAFNKNRQILSLDINSERIKFARDFNASRSNIQFRQLDLFQLSANQTLNLGIFDLIIMSEVLEHLTEEDRALKLIFDALLPGGHFVISVPNKDRLKNILYRRRQRGLDTRMDPDHVREYTVQSLADSLVRNGFEVLKMEGICVNLPGDRLLQWVLPHSGRFREWLTKRRPDYANYFLAVARRPLTKNVL